MTFGIERIRVHPSTLTLRFEDLCAARGHHPAETLGHLLVRERSVMPAWEDPVTMATNAARPLVSEEDRSVIGLLIVGTETPVDLEKPISTWVHRFLGLPTTCRNFEIKHACYSVTAAVQMALAWLATNVGRNRKALVIGTDASLLGLGTAHEYVLGAGAAAILLSDRPDFLAIETDRTGVYAAEVTDVIRPGRSIETGNSTESLFAYLEGVEDAYDAFQEAGEKVDFADFAHVVYHAPFGGITFRAHRRLLGRGHAPSRDEAWADFERRSLPGLCYHRRTGGVYGSSTFLSLLAAIDIRDDLRPGDPIGIFSFGSGSCAEFYRGRVGPRAREIAAEARLAALLDERQTIDVAEYEALERTRDASVSEPDFTPDRAMPPGHWERNWAGRGRLALRGVRQWVREYAWT
ncbi:hydroxymethylglutaryl-CoA synthase family protein [Krasilnikovia sp. MM14-A1259]|uniref:hydroxymethylglutaryl-CoA synthase family protein n=1 Tax=Krasilnikovia sp. MM14-A1259 TaxID=3373539 RepID=UPI0037FFD11E